MSQEKILTISVAAYNVESYIAENLDSILITDVRDEIEVLVVDDGGNDDTLEIARKYEEQYPGIIRAVHKENGGYGSVQNYSMQNASGRFFKILDGDDWVDREGLTKLVEYLRDTKADAVVTDYLKGPDKDSLTRVREWRNYKEGALMKPDSVHSRPAGMWSLTYRTSVLRKSGLVLPEHTLYTDRIYATIPFSYVRGVAYLGDPVYCYRTGRDGQSVSRESRIKHIDEYLTVTETMCRHYAQAPDRNKNYVLRKCSDAYKVTIRILLMLPASAENLDKIIQYEKKIKEISKEIYKRSASPKTRMGCVLTFLRSTGYKGYWILANLPKKMVDL